MIDINDLGIVKLHTTRYRMYGLVFGFGIAALAGVNAFIRSRDLAALAIAALAATLTWIIWQSARLEDRKPSVYHKRKANPIIKAGVQYETLVADEPDRWVAYFKRLDDTRVYIGISDASYERLMCVLETLEVVE